MNKTAHLCPVHICGKKKGAMHVVCRSCWARVSTRTRNEIWSLYRNPKTRGSVSHVEAIRRAIDEATAALMEVS